MHESLAKRFIKEMNIEGDQCAVYVPIQCKMMFH